MKTLQRLIADRSFLTNLCGFIFIVATALFHADGITTAKILGALQILLMSIDAKAVTPSSPLLPTIPPTPTAQAIAIEMTAANETPPTQGSK